MIDKRSIMKKKILIVLFMAAALVALPAMGQSFGYRQSEDNRQWTYTNTAQTFRSTSAMPGSGSAYSASPMLNENGIATYGNETGTSGLSAKDLGRLRRDPGAIDDPFFNQPLGDALLPLFLLALAYAGYKVLARRKKSVQRE